MIRASFDGGGCRKSRRGHVSLPWYVRRLMRGGGCRKSRRGHVHLPWYVNRVTGAVSLVKERTCGRFSSIR